MRYIAAAFVTCCVVATSAHASDKPAIGPAPAWVKPVAAPPAPAQSDGAAARILLSDQQVALEKGRETVYSDSALQIETSQGLAAGNISFAWRPDTDTPVVHKLLIRRGDKVIDVLASGQTFTVMRREQNLESATLDGVLTANIQPEGLQVGDIIEFAVSISSSDPVMKGHVEEMLASWNDLPVERAHLRVHWPSAMPVRIRRVEGLPPLAPIKAGATTSVELSLDHLKPLVLPSGAPNRYRIGRLVELSDFGSWADLAALMAPLYDKAATIPAEGTLKAELDRIRGLSPDPVKRAEAALALVQDKVRYVALAMGEGGLVPADAGTTWSRRYGDCKGKTALLLALLHGLAIDAEPVLVSTTFGDGLDQRLPMIGLFNHVIVRATIAGRTYWLDGTRTGDTSLDRLRTPNFGWGLPLVEKGAALVRMLPEPLKQPSQDVSIRMDATAGLTVPAPATVETTFRGDAAIAMNAVLANLAGDARDRALKDYWRGQYDFIDVTSVDTSFDVETGELRLTMKGNARMDWSDGWYETDGTSVGYRADFHRDPGPDQDAPYAVNYPYYSRNKETILLPPGFSAADIGDKAEVDQTAGGIEYHRHASLDGNVYTIEETERSIVPEFPAADAPAAEKALRQLFDRTVFLRRPPDYRPTEQEIAAMLKETPSTAAAFIDRGNALLDKGRIDEAMADFNHAIALDPRNVLALADRAIAHVWKRDFDAAANDLDAAQAIDPKNAVVFRARGLLAELQGEPKEAVAAYTTALEIEPGNSFALGHRAVVNRAAGNIAAALQDSAAALRLNPKWTELRLLRANIFHQRGENDKAIAEADALAAAMPDDGYAQVTAANIYAATDKRAESMRAYDRALAIKPEAYIYLNRSENRPHSDVAGRRADVEAALRLEPDMPEALQAKARLLVESGDPAAAVAVYSKALAKSPDSPGLLAKRGIAYLKSGDETRARQDFAQARSEASKSKMSAVLLNNICWAKATAGVALESALADCDAAVKSEPKMAGFLDSRGLVLLRLGRLDEAIAEYDRALAEEPALASSLFGRAVAWARKGDKAKADADKAAALKADPDVADEYKGFGIQP